MTTPTDCRLIGRWRIVEADLWDRGHLDLGGPAMLVIHEDGHGEIAFGALNAGFDEMDEVNGSGSAELLDDGSVEIEFAYHLGDEATLKAERATISAAC